MQVVVCSDCTVLFVPKNSPNKIPVEMSNHACLYHLFYVKLLVLHFWLFSFYVFA